MLEGHRTGILLINLGTPSEPTVPAVRRYLREFLQDPRVIDIPWLSRWILVNLVVAPFRAPKSCAAYQKVWLKDGSPLAVYGEQLRAAIQEKLPDMPVELGMRYGQPSIRSAMDKLTQRGCSHIIAVPLYPQYASSSTGTALEQLYAECGRSFATPYLTVVPPFYAEPGYIDAFAAIGRPRLAAFAPDHVLFSFHGLPERQIRKADATGTHCLASADCCERADVQRGANCYRAQCHRTATLLAQALDLPKDKWTMTFQSRLGRTKWIEPYTDKVMPELLAKGVRRLAVYSPAFVADCLETLEELGIRAREEFIAAGGEDLLLIPSLNAEPVWVDALTQLIVRAPTKALPRYAGDDAQQRG